MKLDCSLVEDLYPLYEENELRQENRRAVEEHVMSCEKCKVLYQDGIGFSDLLVSPGNVKEKLSKEVDDRIRLRFRLGRMKVIAALLASVIFVSIINNYAANREKVATLLDGVYQYGESLNEIAKNPYDIDMNREFMSYTAEDIVEIDNELIWLERNQFMNKSFPLLVDTQGLDEMAVKLRERKRQGLEDETDLKAIRLLQKYTNTYFKQVTKEYREFHHGYSSYFELIDIEGMGEPISKINELTFFYTRYHKLPSEMKLMKESRLKENIRTAFNAKDGKIELDSSLNYHPGVYEFDLKHGKTEIQGQIDGYSGFIFFASGFSPGLDEKKQKDAKDVMKKAEKMLKSIYGENARFEIKYEQNKDRIEGQPVLYRYRFTPLAGEYKMHFSLSEPFVIEFDAGTRELNLLSAKPNMLSKEFFTMKPEAKLTPASLETKAAEVSGGSAKEIGTGIIYSSISADYVLVHIFEGKENWVYINAENGIIEKPYLPMH